MKHIAISLKNWLFIAVLPTIVLFFILAFFYKPLNNRIPGTEHVYIRGTIIEKHAELTIITFEETSAFWDITTIGIINDQMGLYDFQDSDQYEIGEKIIVRGYRGRLPGQIEVIESFPDRHMPLTLDWRISLISLFVALTIGSLLYSNKDMLQKKIKMRKPV